MHAEMCRPQPGNCPKCGMTLEPPKFEDGKNAELVGFQRRFWWTLPLAVVVTAGTAIFIWYPRLKEEKLRAAALVAAAAFSHWLLDALVHVPELPLAGARSMKVGLGLWQSMPVALAAEAFILVAGLCLFVSGASLSRARKVWLTALSLLMLTFTAAGMTVAPPPPSVMAMAASSLVTIIVVCALACWLGRLPRVNNRG